MKPAIVWQLHHRRAFDRAMELRFAGAPNSQEIVERLSQQLIESIARSAARKPFDPAVECAVKYGVQNHSPERMGAPPPSAAGAMEEWLEVRYRFVDDKTAEIVSVISQTLAI
jgi:hypothetical protein